MALLGQYGPVRRLFWLGIGTVAGAAGTVWTERKVKERLDALAPEHAVKVAAEKAKGAGRTVVEAVTEGRSAMVEREQELRARRDAGRPSGAPGLRVVDGSGPSAAGTASGPRAARR